MLRCLNIVEIRAVTSLLAGRLGDALGRRQTLFFGATIFVVGGAIQTAATGLNVMVIGRLVSGAGVGLLSCVNNLLLDLSLGKLIDVRVVDVGPSSRYTKAKFLRQITLVAGFLSIRRIWKLMTVHLSEGNWRASSSLAIL